MEQLSKEELHIILGKEKPKDKEKVRVIVRYILDRKKEDMSKIPIIYPETDRQLALMNMMYSIVKQYYLNGK